MRSSLAWGARPIALALSPASWNTLRARGASIADAAREASAPALPDPTVSPPRAAFFARLRAPIVVATAIALLVHLPVPMFSFLRLARRALVMRDALKPVDEPEVKAPDLELPIELVELPKPPPPKELGGAPALPDPASPAPKDAEVKLGAGKGHAQAEAPKAEGDDGAERAKEQRKQDEKEELGIRGAKDALAKKPAVMLAMWLAPLRETPLAEDTTELFACAPEWRPFLAEGVRPLDDVEGVLVTGPKLRDGSKMTAAVQHKVPAERARAITAALIAASGPRGGALESGVSRIVLMRRERAVFEHPTDMLFVTPVDGYAPIFRSKEPLSLPTADGRVLSLTLQKPSRELARLGVKIPSRMRELKIDVFANADGGADLQLWLEDASPKDAQAAEKPVSDAVSSLFFDLGQGAAIAKALGKDEIADAVRLPSVAFDAVESRLTATVHFDAAQTRKMLSVLSLVVCPKKKPH